MTVHIESLTESSGFDWAVGELTNLALMKEEGDHIEFVKAAVSKVNLKHVSCLTLTPNTREDVALSRSIATYSKEWQSRYFVKQYYLVDPVFQHGRLATESFDWRPVRNASAKVAAFFADADMHGVGANGMTIPLRTTYSGVTLVSVTSDLPDAVWDVFRRQHIGKLELLAVVIDSIARTNTRIPTTGVKLSMREEEALVWSALGKTIGETAAIMQVAYSSVRTYLDTAKRKLDSRNVTQAVAIAIATGLIPARVMRSL